MVVNGFWIGDKLDYLSSYCIKSWVKQGYEFHLWTYNKLKNANCILRDANEILEREDYFTYDGGHSKGTPVAFSNLFRAHLLYKLGGLYTDLDVYCLKKYDFKRNFTFSKQKHNKYRYSVGTHVIYSRYSKQNIFDNWINKINELRADNIRHGDLGPDLLTSLINKNILNNYVVDEEIFSPVGFYELNKLNSINYSNSYGVHLYGSQGSFNDINSIVDLDIIFNG